MPSPLPWIVQKFGGTSIGKLLDTITEDIIPSYYPRKQSQSESQRHSKYNSDGSNIIVVCSARSGVSKSTGTTSLLLRAASLAKSHSGAQEKESLDEVIDLLIEEHRVAAREALQSEKVGGEVLADTEILIQLERDIVAECEAIRSFLHAAKTVGELSPRSRDRVISTGEKLSSIIVAATLTQKGFDTALIMLDDIVSETYGSDLSGQKAAYDKLGPAFYHGLAKKIGQKVSTHAGRICVLPGFFGMMPHSLIQTVGRGYSDLCAAMCAVGVNALELQIWKEVDGIFTADPSKVPSARLLATVTPEEAMELTFYGSEVIHPLTMKHIQSANIPLRIKNVKSPQGPGTMIYPSENGPEGSSGSNSPRRLSPDRRAFMDAHGYEGDNQCRRTPTAITSKKEVTVMNIVPNGSTQRYQFMSAVLSRMSSRQVVPDLMCTSEQAMSFAIHDDAKTDRWEEVMSELMSLGNVTVLEEMSIVSVIGQRMRNMVGIAAEILSTLSRAGINIYLISQGASQVNISFVIREEHTIQAINVIHSQILNIPPTAQHTGLTGKNGIRGPWLF